VWSHVLHINTYISDFHLLHLIEMCSFSTVMASSVVIVIMNCTFKVMILTGWLGLWVDLHQSN